MASFTTTLRGLATVFNGFGGVLRGRHRAANDALARYELFVGQDGPPDFGAAPFETFTVLPHVTAPLAAPPSGTRFYHLVVRRRNRWGLSSLNVTEFVVEVNAAGAEVAAPPSEPTGVRADAAAGRTVRVRAVYDYPVDGEDQADAFLVYSRSNGTDPDPAVDTPLEVAMGKADGVARLDVGIGPFTEGATVKVIVRVRRNGSPDVDSRSLSVVSAVATAAGPAAVEMAVVI